ncbi:cholecystokinin receptor-like [Haliotis rufescens]|uniref:cholecystokinin receptor-like n=1 Tax=Haliotis rufescens TaxID=6454 RepID=UPI00201F53DB|nr:cholecystokinin receptor-like [Haliotis rufescens]
MASRSPVTFSDTTHFGVDNTTAEVTSSLNISDEEKNRYLSHLDDSMFPLRIPAVVYLGILMVLGIFGNILVLIVYLKKFKPSPTRVFVVCLAVFDLMTCVISIPGEILDMRYSHTFDYPVVCRMIRFNNTFSVVSSGFTLIAVAIDRYRKICRPLNKQITIRVARMMVGIAVSVSLVLTIPTVIVNGRKTVKTDKEEITGFECSFDDGWRGTLFPVVYIGVLFLIFFGSLSVLVVVYILIGRTVFNHRKFKFRPAKDKERHSSNYTTETSFKDGTENGIAFRNISSPTAPCNVSNSNNGTLGFDGSSETSCTCMNDTSAQPKTRKEDNSSNSVRSIRKNAAKPKEKSRPRAFKTTLMLFIITVVFIISFLPHLILMITRFIKSDFLDSLQGAGFMVYNVFLRSYVIQSAVNCIVYSFCNERFRNEWRKLLVSCCR